MSQLRLNNKATIALNDISPITPLLIIYADNIFLVICCVPFFIKYLLIVMLSLRSCYFISRTFQILNFK